MCPRCPNRVAVAKKSWRTTRTYWAVRCSGCSTCATDVPPSSAYSANHAERTGTSLESWCTMRRGRQSRIAALTRAGKAAFGWVAGGARGPTLWQSATTK
eukprot:13079774-Alexandrium_andersonii.AAC.1